MLVNGVKIFDTFAEAFPMRATRLIVTAYNAKWAMYGASSMTGFDLLLHVGVRRQLKLL